MSVDKPSVVKDCVVTSVACGLAVGGTSAVVGAIVLYYQELLALAVTFGASVTTAFGPVAEWLSQDIPSAVKWILAGAFLWSFCISHNLNKKGVKGRYATVVNRIKVILICGFGLYWFLQAFIAMKSTECVLIVGIILFSCLMFRMLCRLQDEEDRQFREARESPKQDVDPAQGKD